ncbi:phosphonate ABC transporter permease [Brevibacillus reuszeri]|uniref:Phosphate ABC transporter permease n=1 Tax=Brevibacillus reuszeri TaxID=54915 RepID=A0A0K9YS19_9BACL|nr:phosphonate ABC transporter, permease protein PhnE [Brevibacillus reuszeri]KNB71518.1 phosphate ABC transporter permease [Brevibacillus reuszeri]MED1855676.1 phosphonate ABC transporter, permease protein PhnE [Brevibacillus reuszeri]GED67174.1 phosphonate ABC transporter permease [Brevibacillus reuszeri]
MNQTELRPPSKMKWYLNVLLLLALLIGSSYQTDASLLLLVTGTGEMGKLLAEMFPPDWSYLDVIWKPMLQTVQMAIVGTTIGGIMAIPLAFFAANNVFSSKLLHTVSRFVMNLIRTVPELLFAGIFVAIFGLGPFAGVLAITFFSFALISKLTYEAIEAIDRGPLEAMTAVGANKLQWIHFGITPQIIAHYITFFLYTFEVNIRAAAVLGLVGAGGIGLFLDRSLNQLRYDRASIIILATLAIVLIIDFVSSRIRERML